MPAPYLMREVWPDFVQSGATYSFEHLREIRIDLRDSAGEQRSILVSFSDHVFTRDIHDPGEYGAVFPGCSRNPGFFCVERYSFSLHLPVVVPQICNGKVWNLTGADRYAQIPVVTHDGAKCLYAIIFTLNRVTGLPCDLHMQIRSAYPCLRKVPDTFGEVQFRHLVKLRIENRHPKKIYERRRKKPREP